MKYFILTLLLFSCTMHRSYAAMPVETVARIGDKLVRETPFRYRLTLNTVNRAFDNLHFVDFGRTFGTSRPALAYALTELTVRDDTLITIEIEHNDACKVWCNGTQVYLNDGRRPLALTQEERSVRLSFRFPVALKKGQNRLLIKSETAGGHEWAVFIQPPSEKEAVRTHALPYPAIGLEQVPDLDASIAALSNWLVIGTFPAGIHTTRPPEEEALTFGRLYNGVAWTIPKTEVLADLINPAPWGTAYQWNYHNGGLAWAMQQLTETTGNDRYRQWANRFCDFQLEGLPFVTYQVEHLRARRSANHYILNKKMLDFTLAPSLPFIYRLRNEKNFPNEALYRSFIDEMMTYARSGQIRSPHHSNYTRETPETYTTWVDDMFMGIPFLMQAGLYAETPELRNAFFDDAVSQTLDFTEQLWDAKAQLYMHARYSQRPHVKLPHWSRANGWAAWAMTEVLMHLPKTHPGYRPVLDQFRRHMRSLEKYQNENGYWHNVIDRPDSPEEVSGTAIFAMAIARGIRLNLLDRKHCEPLLRKAWNAIASEIDNDGTVHKICVGTMCSEDVEYYVHRPFYDNDTHGSFAVIFAGIEVQRALYSDTHVVPVSLNAEEIEYLKKDLEKKDAHYDPHMKMLSCVTRSKHYHSDLDSGVVVHQTRESLEYAVALLKTKDSLLMQRAVDIIRTVLPMQERDTLLPYCGVWCYYPEDPLRGRKAPVDYNWADFIAVPLIDILINHSEDITPSLVHDIKEALIPAARSIKKRNVQPDYTNICIMGTYVCYMVGDLCHLPEMTAYARERLRNFYGYTLRNGGFAEYNSPTYTLVSMDELLRMKQTILHPDDRRMIEDLYTMTWDLIARHFHHPSGQWCGPHLRAYNDLADADFYRLLYNASGGRIELPGDYLRIPNVIKPHCIPESVMPKFSQPVLPRLEIDTFVSADPLRKEIVGKLYASPAFALASVNQSYMWNQTRPLIAHWGTPEKPSCLRVRFLHDKHDFSAVNIASVQDSTSVLAIFNIAVDGGDTHPILDPIQNASIRASDLRLRIEAGGNLDGLQFTIPDRYGDAAGFDTPTVEAAFQIPYAGWDNYTGHWEKWADEKHCGIDYVLYSGETRTFRLDEMQEAVVGLYLAFSDKSGDELALPNVTSERQGDYLILSTKQMTIKAPAKPDKESRIKNDISH